MDNNIRDVKIGYIYNKEGEYISILLKDDIENIASFVARCSPLAKVTVTDIFDDMILTTMGNFLDKIYDLEYREKLLEKLYPLQIGASEPNDIEFLYTGEDIEKYGMNKEEFIKFVEDKLDYRLVGVIEEE